MTHHEAKSIARHLGLTLRKVHSGDYRVNFPMQTTARLTTRTISKTRSMPQWRWRESAHCQPTPRKAPCGQVRNGQSHDQMGETLFIGIVWSRVSPRMKSSSVRWHHTFAKPNPSSSSTGSDHECPNATVDGPTSKSQGVRRLFCGLPGLMHREPRFWSSAGSLFSPMRVVARLFEILPAH